MDDASMENLSLPGAFNSSPTEQMDITSSDDVTRNHPGPSQTPQSPTEQMDITSSDDDARNHPGPSQTPQLQSQILKPQESGKRKRSDHEEISSRKLIAVEPEYLQELEFAVDELTKKLKSKDKEIKRLQSIEPSVNDLKDAEIRHLRVVEQKVETLIIGKIYISKEKSASDGAYKTLQSQFEDYKRVRFPGFMLSYLRLSIEQDVDRQHKEASRAKEHEMSELEAKFKQQIEELQIHHDRTVEELNKKVESQSLQISSLVEDSLEESETAKILLNEPNGEGSNILEEDTSHIKELEDSNMAFTEQITAYEAQIAKLNADLEEQKAESSKLTHAVQELEGQSVDGISKQERITELEALVRAKTTELEELKHSTSHAQDLENRINELQARLGEFEREREGQSIDGISKQECITELEALVRAKTTELEELKHSTSHAQDLENRINELQGSLQESDSEREKLIQAQQSSSHRKNVLASELQTVREKRSEQIKTLTAQVQLLENELSGNQTALKDQDQELERLRAASTQRRTADEAEIAKLNANLKALKDSQQSSADRGALDADHIQKLEAQLTAQTNRVQQLEIMNAASIENASAYETRVKQLESDLEAQKAKSSKLTRAVQELEGQSVDGISKQERITELEALVRAKTTELEELKHSTSHAQDLENRINELQACLGEFEREREGQSIDGISKQERITELEALVRAKTTELEELKHSTSHAQDLENRINELQARLQESDSEREKLIQAQQSSSHRENVLASELQTVREKRSEQIKTLTAQVQLLENELSGNQTALKDQGQELERLRAASTQRRTADEAEIAKLNADLKDQKAESSRLTRAVQELEGQLTDGIDRENRIVQLNNDLDAKTAELKKSREESTSHAQQLENRIGDLQARLQDHRENVFASELQTVREKRSEQIKTLNARVRDLEKELEQAATNSRDSLSKERERYQQMSVEFQKQQAALSQTTEDLSTVKAALEKEFEDHGNTKSLLELLQSDLVDSQKAISILNSQLEATMADHIEFGEEAQDSDSAMDPDAPESTPSATGKSQKAAGKRRQMSMMPDTTLYTLMNHRNGDLQVNMEPENSAERPTFSNFFNQTEFTPTLSTSANRSSPVRDGDLASSSNPGPSIPNRFSKPGHYRRGRATHQSPPPPSSAIPRSGRDDVRGVEASTAFHADTPATVADPSVVPPHSVFSSTPPVTPVPPVASVSAAERAFQERILNTLSTLSSDVRGVVSDVQELRSNANTQPATPRRRIPNRKPYSPYKQAGPNASRQLQQYLLGISEDDDIFIMDSIHIASPAEVDKFENSLRDPPPLEPLQLHFDQVKVKWNAYLADLFAEQFLRLHSNLNATADQIKEHFMARVQMFREKLISIVPRPGETSEQCFDRVREERLNANRRKRRRTRQRNKLYVDRYSNCIDAGRHDIADVVLTLGKDGMSEDETDGEDSTVVLLTQWRNPKLLTPLKIADSLRPATSVNGTRRPGSRPLKRRRLQSAREGYQPAPDQRPENYYYSSWRACLSCYDIALLKMKDAKPFFGE
ncbi:hypothetical protein JR316_0010144 [Psilocybe cubensis]|uniref:Uncharacterized protein n=1 Tax=Psilocybe cubensis TaxID=181762 RepID=A0ACB8GRB1_PSICU|nr:hypothetical protein JR316_0010144 [Psilocybe cubensis]KAH9477912.1 hypothetical protein JR316_0010144 [Psilocybe cubensis]